jgi:hypothetical protein
MKRIPLTIRMNESVAEDLRVQAAKEVRTLGDIVEEALSQYWNRKEVETVKLKEFAAQVYIDLEGGGFTAETLRCYGGSRIVFQGIYWDAETETETEAELEVLLSESVERLLPEWEEAAAEEIQEAAVHSWVEWRVIEIRRPNNG